mmetsp:Transcript_37980/g.46357  ORF Transcript_37980/g.46357 Transcript_37980/m.46357 type:complete len:93 (+) Transcript_37980:1994-2272(+)
MVKLSQHIDFIDESLHVLRPLLDHCFYRKKLSSVYVSRSVNTAESPVADPVLEFVSLPNVALLGPDEPLLLHELIHVLRCGLLIDVLLLLEL